MGGYYVKGGIYRLVDALLAIAGELGVQVRTAAKVEKICQERKRVSGVQINGKKVEADYVLCGADAVVAYNELIDGHQKRRERLNRLEPSLSGMVFLWGVRAKHPKLAHHNIIFSSDYDAEFKQIFKHQQVPDEPTIYIAVTSKADAEHAPTDGENWFVLLNMPYLTRGQMWVKEAVRMRSVVLATLKRLGFDIADQIEVEQVYTPEDFSELYASNQGSLYGISSNSKTTAFKRIPNRSRVLDGLYFAGGSVHPGGGIPLVLLSGKMAATLIAADQGKL